MREFIGASEEYDQDIGDDEGFVVMLVVDPV
jgi:hypothetical protein